MLLAKLESDFYGTFTVDRSHGGASVLIGKSI